MTSGNGLRVFRGPIPLLVVSFLIYVLRYPLWFFFKFIEPIFVMLILSYLAVLILALFLLKKDSKKVLGNVFKMGGHLMVFVGIVFAFLYLGLWYLISFTFGSKFEFTSFPSLAGYENYAVYYLPFAFALQLVFTVFGAFAEEVAYRGYVQTWISSRYGYVVGILVATLFFSLQHIHIFQVSWIERFFQTQFLHVLLFGIFVGYLFLKSKENIWSVISFHALINIYSVSVPIAVTSTFPYTSQIAEISSFLIMILLLHFCVRSSQI